MPLFLPYIRRFCDQYTDLVRIALLPSMDWAVMPLERGLKVKNYGFRILYRKIFRQPVF